MSKAAKFTSYPGHGQTMTDNYGYSQAVKAGPLVRCSGQAGWNDAGEVINDQKTQVDNAFDNMLKALQQADPSVTWADVISIRTFHTNADESFEFVVEQIKSKMPHKPVWVAVEVPKLALPGLLVEMEADAYKP